MKRIKHLFIIAAVGTVVACSPKAWQVTQTTSTKIPIDNTAQITADPAMGAYILPLKEQIDAELNVVIGQSTELMKVSRPESLLSNFSADMFREVASEYLKVPVDIAVVNIGGLRTEIPQGNITKRKIFEIMPFENELVILYLPGNKVMELINIIARLHGEGISGVYMGIKEGKPVDVTINGLQPDVNKIYTIATNDYLAGGNDKLTPLGEYTKRIDTGLKIRNVYLDYISNKTKAGEKIHSQLDGRIYEVK